MQSQPPYDNIPIPPPHRVTDEQAFIQVQPHYAPEVPRRNSKRKKPLHGLHFSSGRLSHLPSPIAECRESIIDWSGAIFAQLKPPIPEKDPARSPWGARKSSESFPRKLEWVDPPTYSRGVSKNLTGGSQRRNPEKESHDFEIAFKTVEERKTWRFYAAFSSLCIMNFVCALDATSLAVALPIVATSLNGTGIEAFWAGTSFLLTATVFQPTFASLSHVFGRLQMLLLALVLFTAGAIIPALAQNFTVLLFGRSVQGIGAGGISTLTYVIVTDMVTLKERGKWFGLITMMWAIGSVTGPVIGGALAEKASWRWIFWINLPFCGIGFVAATVFLRFERKSGHIIEKLKQKDWIGSFLFIASLTSFLIPTTWGGVMYDWNHWRTSVPLTFGVLGLVVFMAWSKFFAKEPILRSSMFNDATALVTYFGTVVHGMFLWSALYYSPMYFEAAKGYSPTTAGVALFPWTFTIGPAAVVVGIIIAITGRYRWGVFLGWVLTVLGIGLLVLLERDTPVAKWVGIALVSGLGLGTLYSAMSFAIQASASSRDLPFAAALYSFFRYFGQMLGVAVGGVIFQNQVRKNLNAYPELASRSKEFSRDASALVETIKKMPDSQAEMKANLIQAYIDSLHVVFIVMCTLSAVAMILSFIFTKDRTLDRSIDTEQKFVGDKKQNISEV